MYFETHVWGIDHSEHCGKEVSPYFENGESAYEYYGTYADVRRFDSNFFVDIFEKLALCEIMIDISHHGGKEWLDFFDTHLVMIVKSMNDYKVNKNYLKL